MLLGHEIVRPGVNCRLNIQHKNVQTVIRKVEKHCSMLLPGFENRQCGPTAECSYRMHFISIDSECVQIKRQPMFSAHKICQKVGCVIT